MNQSKPPRSWKRFSLRFFLLLVTIVTLFCIWHGRHLRAAAAQRDAIDAFTEHGGWTRYDVQLYNDTYVPGKHSRVGQPLLDWFGYDYFHRVEYLNLCESTGNSRRINSNLQLAPLEHLAGVPKLRRLHLKFYQANDKNLRHVAHLKHLERLSFTQAREVSDEGVQHLASLKQLTHVRLDGARLTNKSLQILSHCKNLKVLHIGYGHFSREGFEHLRKLPKLEYLGVCGMERDKKLQPTPPEGADVITDECLEVIGEIKTLRALSIFYAYVTPEAITAFQRRHPNCNVSTPRFESEMSQIAF